jgi:hypothetical protein
VISVPYIIYSGRLRAVATHAEALAEHKEREARLEGSADQEEVDERPDDLPASLTKRRSRSRRSTTIATTTGNGEKATR